MNDSDYSTTTLPLLFVSISIVVTFLVTRLIRAGKGPFKDNVTEDGVHVRHAVQGIFALLGRRGHEHGGRELGLPRPGGDPHRRGRLAHPGRVRVFRRR